MPPGPNRDPESGARVAEGWLQLGLTRSELEGLEARLKSCSTASTAASCRSSEPGPQERSQAEET